MSLHAAAQHLSDQGRGPDNTLVHMSRDEVKSLNDLAMAHGGHLTINPETGLPEAGFLSSILPMVAGAALNAYAPGLGAMGSALITGAATGALTGNLNKGLMAGLGAYGGAGLMGGFMGAGEQALTSQGLGDYAGTLASQGLEAGTPAYGEAASKMALAAQEQAQAAPFMDKMSAGFSNIAENPGQAFKDNWKYLAAASAPSVLEAMKEETPKTTPVDKDPGQKYVYSPGRVNPTPTPDPYGREQRYFNSTYTPIYAGGGPVEMMSNENAIGANTGYPMADINKGAYATPYQTPISRNVVGGVSDTGVNPMTGEMANFASGGLSDLGSYSDGGRLLRGPGDGVSDSIPAMIGKKQPARLADGEFVVPARIVSELGNGSTEAGARKLYAMMDRVQKARGSTTGKGNVAKNSRADKYLPA